MQYSQRDQSEYRPQFGGFRFFPPVIKYMIIINVVMFFLQNMMASTMFTFGGEPLGDIFVRTTYLVPLGEGFRPWQLVTYMFLHGSFTHIFFNMLMLWMFGMEVENTWGSKRFLLFYFVCGIAAGLSNLFIAPLFAAPALTIGASGAVYGVLVAFAMMFPNRYIYFYFLLPIKAKYLIPFFLILELYNGIAGTAEGIAHMAHLGGALIAAIWVLLDSRGMIDRLIPTGRLHSGNITGTGIRSSWTQSTREASIYQIKPEPKPKPSGDTDFDRYQKVIDEILDKISHHGYSGLTEEEKRILLDASKRIHPDKGMNA
jgi:membrane associated rhomboid family serine protease